MLIKHLELEEDIATCSSLMAGQIAAKNGNSKQSEKEELRDQITELKTFNATMQREGFNNFQKQLAGNLKSNWEKTVKEVCDSPTHKGER